MGKRSRERQRAGRQHSHRRQRQRQHQRPADALATVEGVIVGAAGAFAARRSDPRADAAFEEYVEMLAEGPGGADGHRLVDRAFMSLFDRTVESTWGRGWQPADVVRVVTRDVGARHARSSRKPPRPTRRRSY